VSWPALILSLAAFAGPCDGVRPAAAQKHCLALAAARNERDRQLAAERAAHAPAPAPEAPIAPAPTATPTPSPTPTATPGHPSRTGVDLVDGEEWTVRPSYRVLAAGRIDFVATNVGEDDHDLSVRQGAQAFGRLALAPGESDTLTLQLAAGTYTLFCSLPGHEDAGMRANVSVR
jgi:plastocyanin